MNEWCSRPLLPVYAAVFIDATDVKVHDGQVTNRGVQDIFFIVFDGLKGLPDS